MPVFFKCKNLLSAKSLPCNIDAWALSPLLDVSTNSGIISSACMCYVLVVGLYLPQT